MKKFLLAASLMISSLTLAQADLGAGLAEVIQKYASDDFLYTSVIETPTLKKIMGDPKKADSLVYNLKDQTQNDVSYRVKKSKNFVQIYESKLQNWITFAAFPTKNDVMIAMVASNGLRSAGRGNGLVFYKLSTKKEETTAEQMKWWDPVFAFANGKCKVPAENFAFELMENSNVIKLSGLDSTPNGKKYTLSLELKQDANGIFTFDSKAAKC